jgi:hypothetical protein
LKNVLLTYDSAGALRAVIDTAPYAAEAIAADDEGDIYLLGERANEREGDASYPLLIKYDPSGRMVGRAIYTNLFKSGSDAIQDFGPGDQLVSAALTLRGGNLYVYAPSEREVLVCSVKGRVLRRAKLSDVSAKIAQADKARRAAISDVTFVDENHVVLYVTEYVKPDEPCVIDYSNMHTAIYLVDLTTKKFKLILRGEPGMNPGFLGTKGNQLFTLARGKQGYEFQAIDLQ